MKKTFEQIASGFLGYSMAKCQVHYNMAEKYKSIHRAFGTLVVIVTTIVGTSVFTSLSGSTSQLVQIVTAVLSVAGVVLATLQTFLNYGDLQAQHKTAGVGYAIVRRDIEMLILKYPEGKGRARSPESVELELIKKHLDDLDTASPTIPNNEWDKAWANISKKSQ